MPIEENDKGKLTEYLNSHELSLLHKQASAD